MPGGYEIVIWALLVVASITDLIWGKIYNAVTLPVIAAGLIYRPLVEGSKSGSEAMAAVALAFILFYPLWRIKTFSAGDVKLLMAIGAWSNYVIVLKVGFLAILLGALVGLVVLIRKEGLRGSAKSLFAHLRFSARRMSHRMPFGPAFLCALFVIKIAETKHWSLFWW